MGSILPFSAPPRPRAGRLLAAAAGRVAIFAIMSFYHIKTFLDARLLTQKARILQKFPLIESARPGGRKRIAHGFIRGEQGQETKRVPPGTAGDALGYVCACMDLPGVGILSRDEHEGYEPCLMAVGRK